MYLSSGEQKAKECEENLNIMSSQTQIDRKAS